MGKMSISLSLPRYKALVCVTFSFFTGSVVSLDLQKNRLEGDLPDTATAWDFPNMTSIILSNNKITGSISDNFVYGLPNLERLEMHNNDLAGSVRRPYLRVNIHHLWR